jgi:8-amino-3,8-dideoxy-alpha-D-manno-octulosonate transaminase
MRASKRRIKALLAGAPGLEFRRLNDKNGDSGPFLIFLLESPARAQVVVQRLQAAGIKTAVRLADYGLHIYYNIPQLAGKVPLSPAGNPWNLPQNKDSACQYAKGACPRSDELFARAILVPIPSRLTQDQETAAAQLIRQSIMEP